MLQFIKHEYTMLNESIHRGSIMYDVCWIFVLGRPYNDLHVCYKVSL